MADIFLSYAREDRERAKMLAEALERQGWSVFWDRTIPAGEHWREYIRDELTRSRSLVVAWSTASVDSKEVHSEVEYAYRRNQLVPVFLETVDPLWPYDSVQAEDLSAWDGSAERPEFLKFFDDLVRILGEPAVALAEEPAGPPSDPDGLQQTLRECWAALSDSRAKSSGRDVWLAALDPTRERVAGGSPSDSSEKTPRPGMRFRETLRDGSLGAQMVELPGGAFEMGSPDTEEGREDVEGPVHTVEVPAFAIGRYPVTFAEYDAFAHATDWTLPNSQGWGRDSQPVINVGLDDAHGYADWLSDQTGERYRLPTEAEWEYAARAGTSTRWSFGDHGGPLGNHAWFTRNSDARTHEVGTREPNPWGLFDMHGNVLEWVEDCWHENYEGAPVDGSAWMDADGGDGARRVVRGGSWDSNPLWVRSATRRALPADDRFSLIGFRLARDL